MPPVSIQSLVQKFKTSAEDDSSETSNVLLFRQSRRSAEITSIKRELERLESGLEEVRNGIERHQASLHEFECEHEHLAETAQWIRDAEAEPASTIVQLEALEGVHRDALSGAMVPFSACGASVPPPDDPIEQFRRAAREHGIELPAHLSADDSFHRFSTNGRASDTSGFYKIFRDGLGGVFGDWRSDVNETWQAKSDRPFSQEEKQAYAKRVKEAQRAREQEKIRREKQVAKDTAELLETAKPASADHPYLKAKGVQPHGLLVDDTEDDADDAE